MLTLIICLAEQFPLAIRQTGEESFDCPDKQGQSKLSRPVHEGDYLISGPV